MYICTYELRVGASTLKQNTKPTDIKKEKKKKKSRETEREKEYRRRGRVFFPPLIFRATATQSFSRCGPAAPSRRRRRPRRQTLQQVAARPKTYYIIIPSSTMATTPPPPSLRRVRNRVRTTYPTPVRCAAHSFRLISKSRGVGKSL